MKKLMILITSLALVLTACNNTTRRTVTNDAPQQSQSNQQAEDCDADDLLEGDEDCYGVDLEGSKKKYKNKVAKVNKKVSQVKNKVNVVKKKTSTLKSFKPKKVKKSKSSFSFGSNKKSSSGFKSSSRKRK